MLATTPCASRGPLDKAVAMETEDQVGRGTGRWVDGVGETGGWVDFFITAAIIAPSDRASTSTSTSSLCPGAEGNILVLKIIAASRLANGAVSNWKKSRLTCKNAVSSAAFLSSPSFPLSRCFLLPPTAFPSVRSLSRRLQLVRHPTD